MSRIQHKIIQHTEPGNEVNSQRKRQFTDANLKTVQMLGISDKGFFFHKFIYLLFIYLFLAVLGLHCCAWVFPSCGESGLLFVVVRRLLIAMVSLVVEHGL